MRDHGRGYYFARHKLHQRAQHQLNSLRVGYLSIGIGPLAKQCAFDLDAGDDRRVPVWKFGDLAVVLFNNACFGADDAPFPKGLFRVI